MTEPNPYAPPLDERELAPGVQHGAPGTITCTTVMEVNDMAAGLASGTKRLRWVLTIWFVFLGFLVGASAGIVWQLGGAFGLGAIGWFISSLVARTNARRSLANKSEAERTVTYTFSNEGVEVATTHTYSRVKWPAVHRFVEGPATFSLYLSEALLQIIPKRALRTADIDALRAMFTSHITPRKRPSMIRGAVVVLWLLLVFLFLAVWQFLQSDIPAQDPHLQPREVR